MAAQPLRLLVHGGAGRLSKASASADRQRQARDALSDALASGYEILKSGGTSLDAVTRAVTILEDSPLFNAGRGAVFNREGQIELDASIMDGHSGQAGAVAAVRRVKNPIRAARAVMERSPHVLLIGSAADRFAAELGVEMVDPSYFHTEERWNQLQQELAQDAHPAGAPAPTSEPAGKDAERKFGTVGAVALDSTGNLAAATSTGGISKKLDGRVGDSPVVGAGIYAGKRCAVSGTGQGEYFLRLVACYDICALMEYKGMTVEEAAETVIHGKLTSAGGEGGVIALASDGTFSMCFNSPGMYRGYVDDQGRPHAYIFQVDD